MNAPTLFKCDQCGTRTTPVFLTTGARTLCSLCADQHTCETCGGLYPADEIASFDEHVLCEGCDDARLVEALAAARTEYVAVRSLFDIAVDAADAARKAAKERA